MIGENEKNEKKNVFIKWEELTFLDMIRVVLQETLNVKFDKGAWIRNVKVVQHLEAAQRRDGMIALVSNLKN